MFCLFWLRLLLRIPALHSLQLVTARRAALRARERLIALTFKPMRLRFAPRGWQTLDIREPGNTKGHGNPAPPRDQRLSRQENLS